MEWAFSKKDVNHFRNVLESRPSLFLRVHAVCMLADLKDEGAVSPLAKVLREDASPLVRHEAAFVLGQLGFKSAVPALIEAMEQDDSVLVRMSRPWRWGQLETSGRGQGFRKRHRIWTRTSDTQL